MNKVLQITNLLNQDADTLAKSIIEKYIKIRSQRQAWEEEQRELRNYVFATDTTSTSNNKLPWKNTTTIPKICQIRDNLLANYLDALFPNEEWFIWEGDDESSMTIEKRRIIEMYMRNKIRQSGFREEIEKCLLDYIDNVALGEVIWMNETHYDPILDQDITTYIGPKFLRLSVYDHYFDPTASNYNRTPKFTRYLKNLGELKKDIKSRPNLQFSEETVNKLIKLRKSIHAFSWEDVNKADGYYADGFGSLSEYLGSGVVEIIEFEGDIYDEHNDELLENRIITVADGQYILRNIENPNWLGRDNKVKVSWRDRPDNLYGMGALNNLVGMQYRLDHLENFKADAMDQTIHPPVKIIGDVDPFEWKPGAMIHIADGDGDVISMPPNPAVFQVNNEIDYLIALMEEIAGAPKQAMGIRTPGEKTAFEVQTLENAAGRIFFSKIKKFEIQFIEPVLNLMLESAKRNFNVGDTIKVMDDDLGAATFMTITRDDITAIGKLRPMGARHFAARAQLMQNLQGIFSSQIGQIIMPDLSRKQLTKLIEETMGLSRYRLFKENIAVMEQAETQRMMNEAMMQLEQEQAVPVEENMLGLQG